MGNNALSRMIPGLSAARVASPLVGGAERPSAPRIHHGGTLRRRGVTLLEVVLAMGLLVVLFTMTFWFYSSSMETSRNGTTEVDKLRLARVVLERMATEIRQAGMRTADDGLGIHGDKERVWISTLRVPTKETTRKRSSREGPAPSEWDLVKVEYKVSRHPEILHEDGYEQPLGLARVETLIPRAIHPSIAARGLKGKDGQTPQADGGTSAEDVAAEFAADGESDGNQRSLELDIAWEELYAPEIHYLRFCYYDGYKWWDDWQVTGENPLPQLVMVTVGFDGHPPCGEEFGQDRINEEFCECLNKDPVDCEALTKDQFSTVVRVTGADPLFRSRVSRESHDLVKKMGGGEEPSDEPDGGGGQ